MAPPTAFPDSIDKNDNECMKNEKIVANYAIKSPSSPAPKFFPLEQFDEISNDNNGYSNDNSHCTIKNGKGTLKASNKTAAKNGKTVCPTKLSNHETLVENQEKLQIDGEKECDEGTIGTGIEYYFPEIDTSVTCGNDEPDDYEINNQMSHSTTTDMGYYSSFYTNNNNNNSSHIIDSHNFSAGHNHISNYPIVNNNYPTTPPNGHESTQNTTNIVTQNGSFCVKRRLLPVLPIPHIPNQTSNILPNCENGYMFRDSNLTIPYNYYNIATPNGSSEIVNYNAFPYFNPAINTIAAPFYANNINNQNGFVPNIVTGINSFGTLYPSYSTKSNGNSVFDAEFFKDQFASLYQVPQALPMGHSQFGQIDAIASLHNKDNKDMNLIIKGFRADSFGLSQAPYDTNFAQYSVHLPQSNIPNTNFTIPPNTTIVCSSQEKNDVESLLYNGHNDNNGSKNNLMIIENGTTINGFNKECSLIDINSTKVIDSNNNTHADKILFNNINIDQSTLQNTAHENGQNNDTIICHMTINKTTNEADDKFYERNGDGVNWIAGDTNNKLAVSFNQLSSTEQAEIDKLFPKYRPKAKKSHAPISKQNGELTNAENTLDYNVCHVGKNSATTKFQENEEAFCDESSRLLLGFETPDLVQNLENKKQEKSQILNSDLNVKNLNDKNVVYDEVLGPQESPQNISGELYEGEGSKTSKSKIDESNVNGNDNQQNAVLIEGVLFRASYLGSTHIYLSQWSKKRHSRTLQAREAVNQVKAFDGENQPRTEVDLFISTEKIMILNTNLQEIMMDHALKSISYIADIGNIVVVMVKKDMISIPTSSNSLLTNDGHDKTTTVKRETKSPHINTENSANEEKADKLMQNGMHNNEINVINGEIPTNNTLTKRDKVNSIPSTPTAPADDKMICHVFESEEAHLIAQSIGQAFQIAYLQFLKTHGLLKGPAAAQLAKLDYSSNGLIPNASNATNAHVLGGLIDYQDVLDSQEVFATEELDVFSDTQAQKEIVIPKEKNEPLGLVIVESGWGSMLPTVVIAKLCPGSPATRGKHLNVGDRIIAINGSSLVGLSLESCVQKIKSFHKENIIRLKVISCSPVVEVRIKRPDPKYQLGFSVQNGTICSLLRGGIAERGGIRVGHRIIEINGESMVAIPHEKIVKILSTTIGEIHMKTMPTSIYRLLTGQESPNFI